MNQASNMNVVKLIRDAVTVAVEDLMAITKIEPRERLPKEEQIRCSMYSHLKTACQLIQVEAGYFDADAGGKSECDFRLWLPDGRQCWIELKRAWEGRSYRNKIPELLNTWTEDVAKLSRAEPADYRAFALFTFSDCDPCAQDTALCKAVREFHPGRRIISESRSFSWRKCFGHLGVFAWGWNAGEPLGEPK